MICFPTDGVQIRGKRNTKLNWWCIKFLTTYVRQSTCLSWEDTRPSERTSRRQRLLQRPLVSAWLNNNKVDTKSSSTYGSTASKQGKPPRQVSHFYFSTASQLGSLSVLLQRLGAGWNVSEIPPPTHAVFFINKPFIPGRNNRKVCRRQNIMCHVVFIFFLWHFNFSGKSEHVGK